MTENYDEKTLELLAVFHLVLGIITAIFASIPLIHLFVGIAILSRVVGAGAEVPRLMGVLFVILASFIILAGWILAIMIIISGKRLKERRSYNFCLAVAFLQCLIVPLGTVLGVFTIITLNKEPVRELFAS